MIKTQKFKSDSPFCERAVINVRFLHWILSQPSCFPSHYIWSNCLQIKKKKKSPAQMLEQDVFFTFKWQADCQFLQLVILCKGEKRSLIITISYVWTLPCDGLSTWAWQEWSLVHDIAEKLSRIRNCKLRGTKNLHQE